MSGVVSFDRGRSIVLCLLLVITAGCARPTFEPPETVVVEAGWFDMGRDYDDEGNTDEVPTHKVYLDAYAIGKYPVTNRQFADVLNWALSKGYLQDSEGNPYDGGEIYAYGKPLADTMSSGPGSQINFSVRRFEVLSRGGHGGEDFPMDNHPVLMVTWYGAVAYCNWLSEMHRLHPCYDTKTWERLQPLPNGYRLPTEAEWERAAAWESRAAGGSKHWRYGVSSDTLDTTQANFFAEEYANPLGLSSMPFTSPVDWYNGENPARLAESNIKTKRSASPAGCFDMAGNTWDWCHDWYQEDYYEKCGIANPVGPNAGAYRVGRGGSWRYNDSHCRTTDRYWNWPDYRSRYQGFRIVSSPPR
ncbi:MAG TPA: hypothetical protein ENN29_07650 [Candidatus Hydrogenedentes bacterium]|nr:hypothetical protein [Candidatus Hydrogenedentota bacterium]